MIFFKHKIFLFCTYKVCELKREVCLYLSLGETDSGNLEFIKLIQIYS